MTEKSSPTFCDACKEGKPVRIATNSTNQITVALPYTPDHNSPYTRSLDVRRDVPVGLVICT